MSVVIGYDIGGANLKVARAEAGRITAIAQVPCPLWQGLGELDIAFDAVRAVTADASVHAVTMTGELCELFQSRADGVGQISQHVAPRLGTQARFFMGLKGFGTAAQAAADPDATGSANFLATARLIASKAANALLIDMGSTTTDIVFCDRPQGLTDAERLQTGELVYTGFTRTPVPSVTTSAPLAGVWQTLARDCFATMADVRRLAGQLADDVDMHASADGRGKTVEDCLRRFARGFGRDGEMRHLDVWRTAAQHVAECQHRSIHDGVLQVLSRPGTSVREVIVAGIGFEVAEGIARRCFLPSRSFAALVGGSPAISPAAINACAPAIAVALLASE